MELYDIGHIMSQLYIIACDVYYVYASCLLRTTVVNKMIPYNNFKKVFSPNCALLLKFIVSKHHVMIGCDRFLCSNTTGVDEPSMYRHGLGTHAKHLGLT